MNHDTLISKDTQQTVRQSPYVNQGRSSFLTTSLRKVILLTCLTSISISTYSCCLYRKFLLALGLDCDHDDFLVGLFFQDFIQHAAMFHSHEHDGRKTLTMSVYESPVCVCYRMYVVQCALCLRLDCKGICMYTTTEPDFNILLMHVFYLTYVHCCAHVCICCICNLLRPSISEQYRQRSEDRSHCVSRKKYAMHRRKSLHVGPAAGRQFLANMCRFRKVN